MIRWRKVRDRNGQVSWEGEERFLGNVITRFVIWQTHDTRYLLTVRLVGHEPEKYTKDFATLGAAKGWVTKNFH